MAWRRRWWMIGLLLSSGCAPRELRPAPLAQVLDKDTAMATDNRVRVVAETDAWTGPSPISKAVTPLKLTIENQGDRPVRVQLSKLKLTGPDGTEFSALPPLRISGTVPAAEPPHGWVARAPSFPSYGFGMAPTYAGVFTNELLPTFFPYDAPYYGTYDEWPDQELPTPDMIGLALTEGVLQPGGHVEGFVYFRKLPREAKTVSLSASFDDADEEPPERVASVQIPFTYRRR